MRIHLVLSTLLLAFLAGCGDPESPEAQVRATLADIEAAAEARDVGGLMEHISAQFRDAYGGGGQELSRYVRGYFIANQSIYLLTRIETIEFPTEEEARAKVTVGMVGREVAEANAWNLAAEVHDFDVTFVREDGEWKVTYAKWATARAASASPYSRPGFLHRIDATPLLCNMDFNPSGCIQRVGSVAGREGRARDDLLRERPC